MASRKIRIGDWTATPALNVLESADRSVDIEPRAMDLLVHLAEHAGDVLSTSDLISEVWHGRIVGDHAVYRLIQRLRTALEDDPHDPRYIATIPRRGYRLIAPVEILREPRSLAALTQLSLQSQLRAAAMLVGALALLAVLATSSPWSPLSTNQLDAQTIAVLPFVNLSSDERNDYLGEGIAGEVLHALSTVPNLRVIARTSSFSFRDGSADIAEIAQRLGASVVLEGSVRRENDRLRVIAQLVDAQSGMRLWSNDFERPIENLIAVEREIALAVAASLAGETVAEPEIVAALPQAADISAYEYYLLGRERMPTPTGLTRDWSITDADRTIEYFRRAIALDPSFARAHASLAHALLRRTLIGRGLGVPREVAPAVAEEALAAIGQAEALEPDLAEILYVRGFALRVLEGDGDRGLELYREAIALDPNLVDAYIGLGISLRNEESIAALRMAAQLDPLSALPHRWLHIRLSDAGRLEEATFHIERYVELEPNSFVALEASALDRWNAGRADEAVRIVQSALSDPNLRHEEPRLRLRLAGFYLDLTDYQKAESELRLVEQLALRFWTTAANNTRIHLALAENRPEDVETFVHTWEGEIELAALYEMMIGHEDHAREAYRKVERDLLTPGSGYIRFGYHPAINAAQLGLTGGDRTPATEVLDAARSGLDAALGNAHLAGGAHYVLASIHAIQGNLDLALTEIDEAIASGWTKQWYAVRDPNLETLWEDPRFQQRITGVRTEMERLRAKLDQLALLE